MALTPVKYIEMRKQATEDRHVLELWAKLEDLYHRKLWHELTVTVKEVVEDGKFCQAESLMEFYNNFLHHFESRISRLHFATIALAIARRHPIVVESLQLLEHIVDMVKSEPSAHVICLTGMATLKARQRDEDGKCISLADVKGLLREASTILARIKGVTVAHTEYYSTTALYYREIGDFTRYLENALRYMSTIQLEKIKPEDRPELATRLAIAALLSDQIYCFGYLLVHPIMEALHDTKHQWLLEMLDAFSKGDIEKFEQLRSIWSTQPDLSPRVAFLEEKVRLLGLMSMLFFGPTKSRELTFASIAQRLKIDVKDVEMLLMKALSKELIRGNMDQVEQVVRVSWVMPKILSRSEISDMASAFHTWYERATELLADVERCAGELICQ